MDQRDYNKLSNEIAVRENKTREQAWVDVSLPESWSDWHLTGMLGDILCRACEANPKERYQDARELKADLLSLKEKNYRPKKNLMKKIGRKQVLFHVPEPGKGNFS